MGILQLGNRLMSMAVSAVIALCFLGFGLAVALYFGPQQLLEARRVGQMPHLSASAFQATAADQVVLIYGPLRDNPSAGPDDLVAYARERWEVSQDSDGDWDGSWSTLEEVIPALYVAADDDGVVETAAVGSSRMGGRRYKRTVEQGRGRKVEGIAEGTVRVVGVRNGDWVTVVGPKLPNGTLRPDRLFAGDPAALKKELQTTGWMFTGCGAGMICLSPVIVVAGLFGRARSRIRIGR